MNIVDNRHISHVHNVSCIIKLSDKYVNNSNKNILTNYKKYLNQCNVQIIVKCIHNNINIVPVLRKLSNDDIKLLTKESFIHNNVYMLKKINDYVESNNRSLYFSSSVVFRTIIDCCHINIIKYLYKLKSSKWFQQIIDDKLLNYACTNGHIDFVKFFHRKLKIKKEKYESMNNLLLRWTCRNGYIAVIKYLHKYIGFTKEDFQSCGNYACQEADRLLNKNSQASSCQWACEKGHHDVVRYLHKNIGLNKFDFQTDDNYACEWACRFGHIKIVKYLHEIIGITREDFKSKFYLSYKRAYANRHYDVAKYILNNFYCEYDPKYHDDD